MENYKKDHTFYDIFFCTLPFYIPHNSRTQSLQGYIVVGYRGTFAFGRDMSDVKVNNASDFGRKLHFHHIFCPK